MAVTPPPRVPSTELDRERSRHIYEDDIGREGLRVRIQPVPGLTNGKLMHANGFFFQCPPLEEFTSEYAGAHSDYDTSASGQFSRPGGKQLRIASFDTLFVDFARWAVIKKPIEIEQLTKQLIKLCESCEPFLLTVAHSLPPHGYDTWGKTLAGPELQMLATLRTLKVSEKAGEGDARYVNVSFTEYREPFADEDATGKTHHKHYKHDWPKTVLLFYDGAARDKKTHEMIGFPPLNPVTLNRLAKHYYHHPNLWTHIAKFKGNHIKNWGPNDQLLDYYRPRRPHRKDWPIKIRIPRPPNKGGHGHGNGGGGNGHGGGAGGGGSGGSGGSGGERKPALDDAFWDDDTDA